MARRTRTLEILTAAGLVPQQLAVEQARGARDARVAQALASLVPSAISAGTGALGQIAEYQAGQDLLNLKRDTLTAKGTADKAAAAAEMARADALKVKAEADKVKATADASEATRKASEAAAKDRRQNAMDLIEGGAGSAAALLPTGGERRVVGTFRPGESPLDEIERIQADSGMGLDQLAGLVDKQGLATRKAAADLKLAERKATAPLGPKPKSPEEIERQRKKDELLDEQLKQLKGKPEAAAQAASKLTAGEAESVIELQTGEEILSSIEKLKKSGGANGAPINTGPIEAVESWIRGKAGVESPEKAKFKATAGAQLADYIKSISGGAVSKEERASLLENVPTPADDDEEFLAKLEAVRSILRTKLATKRKAYQATGKDTSIFGAPAPSKPLSEMTDEELAARAAQLKGMK